MPHTVRHNDDHGFHIEFEGRIYRPIIATALDEGDRVRVSLSHASGSTSYVTVRSDDSAIIEDWKATA